MSAVLRALKRIKPDPFLVMLIGTVVLATLLPARGTANEALSATSAIAVFLLFFTQGAKLPFDVVLAGARHWRLHLLVLTISFGLFPLLGIAFLPLAQAIGLTGILPLGLVFLCCLPSTVQSSIAFTSLARGNVAAATCAASASNILGVVVTPALVALTLSARSNFDPSSIRAIALQLLLPFVLGQLARPRIHRWISSRKLLLTTIDRSAILLMVYSAFGQAVLDGIWQRISVPEIAKTLILCAALLAIVMLTTSFVAKRLGFSREDRITILFCGSKKSLVTGVPMANVLFPAAAAGTLILPLMMFHQLQLMVCSVLAGRFGKRDPSDQAARKNEALPAGEEPGR